MPRAARSYTFCGISNAVAQSHNRWPIGHESEIARSGPRRKERPSGPRNAPLNGPEYEVVDYSFVLAALVDETG
ncbi:hypothetical protein RKD27_007970 [Streptomyces sp. SAI-126]